MWLPAGFSFYLISGQYYLLTFPKALENLSIEKERWPEVCKFRNIYSKILKLSLVMCLSFVSFNCLLKVLLIDSDILVLKDFYRSVSIAMANFFYSVYITYLHKQVTYIHLNDMSFVLHNSNLLRNHFDLNPLLIWGLPLFFGSILSFSFTTSLTFWVFCNITRLLFCHIKSKVV